MICQFNIAWMKHPYSDPIWNGWKTAVAQIHRQVRLVKGFHSMLDGRDSEAGYLIPYREMPLIMGNLTAWTDKEALRRFVVDGAHGALMNAKSRWFHPPKWKPYSVFYHAEELDLERAKRELCMLWLAGENDRRFGNEWLTSDE